MIRGENFIEKGKCKNKHCSSMSKSAWCNLTTKRKILKLHDSFPNPKCNCPKVFISTPHQHMLDGGSTKNKLQKIFKGKTAWIKILKSAINSTAPSFGMDVPAKTTEPKVGQATTNIFKSIFGGKTFSMTDMHSGAGLSLRVIWVWFK